MSSAVGEVAAPAGFHDLDRQRDGEVGLAGAGLAEQQDGPALLDEPQGREVGDEFAVNGGLEVEVELVDGAAEREPRVAQPGGHAPVTRGGGLVADELGEELDVGPVLALRGLGQGGEGLGGAVQLQIPEVVLEPLVQPRGHDDTPVHSQPCP